MLKKIINTLLDKQEIDFANFETSPLRFEYDLLLEEYRAMRSQINLLTESQKHIINLSIALIAIFGTIAQYIFSSQENSLTQSAPTILLIFSLTLFFFSLMTFWYDVRIAYSAGYINGELKPRMDSLLSRVLEHQPKAWGWESANAQLITNYRVAFYDFAITVAKYLITIIPALVFYFFYWSKRLDGFQFNQSIPFLEISLFILTTLTILLVIISGIYTYRLFVKLPSIHG